MLSLGAMRVKMVMLSEKSEGKIYDQETSSRWFR